MNQRIGLLIASCAMMAAVGAAQEYEIVVESGTGGQNVEFFSVTGGNWMESASKSKAPGLFATKSRFKTAGSPGAARFAPEIPVAGKYEVFATYPDSGNAAGVIYHIHSAEGDKEIVLDQFGHNDRAKPPANTWFSLGTYQFNQGKDGYLEIKDPETGKGANEKEPNVRVYADAAKWVPVGFALPAQFAKKSGQTPSGDKKKADDTTRLLPPAPVASAMPSLAVPQPTVSSALPSLSDAAGSQPSSQQNISQMPALSSAASAMPSPAQQIPSLASAQQGTAIASGQASSPANVSQMPSLSAAGTAEAIKTSGVGASPSMPSLPGLASTPAPSEQIPPASVNAAPPSLPALGGPSGSIPPAPSGEQVPQLPGLQPGSLPPAPTGGPAGLPPSPGAIPAMAPAAPLSSSPDMPVPTPTSGSGAVPSLSSDGLPWIYDEGSAHAAARNLNKKVLVFFVAEGNKIVEKYEKEYFVHPAVRQALSKFVLRKVNFPQNTKAGYKLEIYGAGNIAVTNAFGEKVGAITALPPTPEELASKLEALAQ